MPQPMKCRRLAQRAIKGIVDPTKPVMQPRCVDKPSKSTATPRTTVDGHAVEDYTISGQAKGMIGNAGNFPFNPASHSFKKTEVKDSAKSFLGNMDGDAFKTFWG